MVVTWWIQHPRDFFLKILGKFYQIFYPNEPWISFRAVRFIESRITNDMIGLEWGSGRSTFWFAQRLRKLTSIEHDETWYQRVQGMLASAGQERVDYRYIPLDHPLREPTHAFYPRIPKYVDVVNEFSDSTLDFVLIDGHYRQACVQAVIKKIKPNGLLAIDNSNWMKLEDWGVPKSWAVVHQSFGFEGETTVWEKPNHG